MTIRVYLSACGIGLGHISRLIPIMQDLNRRGVITVFSSYLDGLHYARAHHLPCYEAPPIDFKVSSDGTVDFKMTAARSGFTMGGKKFLKQVLREIRFIRSFKPNVILTDSRASTIVAAKLLGVPIILLLNQFRIDIVKKPTRRRITFFERVFFLIANLAWIFIRTTIELVWGQSDAILIPDLPPPNTICIRNLGVPHRYAGKIKFIGPILDASSGADSNTNPKRKLGFDDSKPLIYASVSGPRVQRRILADRLIQSFNGLTRKYHIVMSRGEPNGGRFETVNGIVVYDWIKDQASYMKACDVLVGRAGHGTIMKSVSLGKPMILIPTPDQTEQISNAKRANSLGVAEVIDQNSLNSESLNAAITRVLSNEAYANNGSRLRSVTSSSKAISTTCDLIIDTASRAS